MARDIQTRFKIEGEQQFTSAIKNINTEMKTLQSELALVNSQYGKNATSTEGLRAKIDVLTRQYEKQREKLDQMKNALANAETAQQKAGQRISEARDNVAKAEKALDEYKETTGGTAEEQAKLERALESAKQELARAESAQDKTSQSCAKWQQQVNYAEANLNKLDAEIQDNRTALEAAEKATDSTADSVDKLGDEFSEGGAEAKKFGEQGKQGVETLAAALVAAGVQRTLQEVIELLNDCTEAAMSFHAGMAETFTLIPDASDDMRKKLTGDMLEIKNEYGTATEDLTSALYQSVSAGIDATEATDFLALAQRAAIGGVSDLTSAVDGITSVINAYGAENLSAQQAADMMFTAVKYGKTTFGELSASLYNVIPIASSVGVKFEDVTAALASMTIQGVPTAQSTTQLRQMLVELSDSASAVGKTFSETAGVSFKEFIASGRNVSDALIILDGAAADSGVSVNELFGSVEAGNAALSLAGQNADRYAGNIANMEASAGACDTAFETMAETAEYSQSRFTAAAESMQIAIGSALEPALKNIYDAGADAFTWAADFVEQNPWIVGAITGLVTALGLLAAAVAVYNIATTAVIPAITAFNAALASNPIGLIVIGITGLVAVLAGLLSTVDQSANEMNAYGNALEESIQRTKDMQKATEDLQNTLNDNQLKTDEIALYVRQLQKLEEQGLDTAGAQTVYNDTVEKLQALMPEMTLVIDEHTGALEGGTEAILAHAEAMQEDADAAAALDTYTEAIAKYDETSQAIENNTEKIAALKVEQDLLMDSLNDTNASLQMGTVEYEQTQARLSELMTVIPELEFETSKLSETLSEQAGKVDIVRGQYETYRVAIDEANAEVADTTPYETAIAAMDTLEAEIQTLQAEYDAARENIRTNIDQVCGLFNRVSVEVDTSVSDMISALQSQSSYMDEYARNLALASKMGISEGLVAELSDGSTESAKILQAIVDDGGENIDKLNAEFERVQEGKDRFSDQVAKMATDFDDRAREIQNSWSDAVDALNQSAAARSNTNATINAIVQTAYNRQSAVASAYRNLGNVATSAYRAALRINSPSKEFEYNTRMTVDAITGTAKDSERDVRDAYKDLAVEANTAYIDQMRKAQDDYDRGFQLIERATAPTVTNSTSVTNINNVAAGKADGDLQAAMLDELVEMRKELKDLKDVTRDNKPDNAELVDGIAGAVAKVQVKAEAVISPRAAGRALTPEIDKQQGASVALRERGVI